MINIAKKVALAFAIFYITTSCSERKKEAVISIEKDTISFIAKKGQIVRASFTIKNVGDDTLYIKNINTDCGCTTVKSPKKFILPTESSSVLLSYDTKSDSGDVTKTVVVESNTTPILHTVIIAGMVK